MSEIRYSSNNERDVCEVNKKGSGNHVIQSL
jgi:hypothetical protein